MPLVSGHPPRSRWSGPPLSPLSLALLVHLRHNAVQNDMGDLFFGGPGDESFLLAADDVDLVLGGAESYAFSGDIVAHHEVRSLFCELLPYLRGRREVRDRCGHDERVRVSSQIEYSPVQLFHGLDRMVSGPRLDRIYISGHYGNPGAEPQSFAGNCESHLPGGAVPDKTHAIYGLPGAASGHEQPQSAHRASETTE